MTKVTVAFGSFIVGACCMFFIDSGIHTSTFAQVPGIRVGGSGVPKVLPISSKFEKFGLGESNLSFVVDGSECVDCEFSNATLEYGGGAYNFTNFKFSGPVRVSLTGAAANTVAFLNLVQAIAARQRPPAPTPNSPILKTATVKETVTGDSASPYGSR